MPPSVHDEGLDGLGGMPAAETARQTETACGDASEIESATTQDGGLGAEDVQRLIRREGGKGCEEDEMGGKGCVEDEMDDTPSDGVKRKSVGWYSRTGIGQHAHASQLESQASSSLLELSYAPARPSSVPQKDTSRPPPSPLGPTPVLAPHRHAARSGRKASSVLPEQAVGAAGAVRARGAGGGSSSAAGEAYQLLYRFRDAREETPSPGASERLGVLSPSTLVGPTSGTKTKAPPPCILSNASRRAILTPPRATARGGGGGGDGGAVPKPSCSSPSSVRVSFSPRGGAA